MTEGTVSTGPTTGRKSPALPPTTGATLMMTLAPVASGVPAGRGEVGKAASQRALTGVEQLDFDRLEARIPRSAESPHLPRLFEIGAVLDEIRERRLYRAQFSSFEAYCVARWGYHHSHAYRLIGGSRVMKALSPLGDIPRPTKEKHIRALAGETAEMIRQAWLRALEMAVSTTRLSEKMVKEALAEVKQGDKAKAAKTHGKCRRIWQDESIPCLEKALAAAKRGDQLEAMGQVAAAGIRVGIGLGTENINAKPTGGEAF